MGILTDDLKRKILEITNPHIVFESKNEKPQKDPHEETIGHVHDLHKLGEIYDHLSEMNDVHVHNDLSSKVDTHIDNKVRSIYKNLDKHPMSKQLETVLQSYHKKPMSIVSDALNLDGNSMNGDTHKEFKGKFK